MNYEHRNKQIIEQYVSGLSSEEIAPMYKITSRQVQRIVGAAGASRTQSESFILAIKRGRMIYHKTPEHLKRKRKSLNHHLRYKVLKSFKFTCVTCGRKPVDDVRIEVDHKDNDATNNELSNLQVLCSMCNRGKSYADRY